MKKKILFIMDSLRIGGAEKSLLTILNLIDYNQYDVDLYLLQHTGEFYNLIPKQVNVLDEDVDYKVFITDRKNSVINYIKKHDFKKAFYSFNWLLGAFFSKIMHSKLYIGWSCLKNLMKPIEKEYDVSIAFLERKTIYFNADYVKSSKKIGFIHNDYSKYPYNYKLDKKYFNCYNNIATVSEHCCDVLKEIFPEYKEKFVVIKNMVAKNLIVELSNEKINGYVFDKEYINIVSVGRLVEQKGFDKAIEICRKLVDNNVRIHWYIVGEGEERKNLEEKIKELHLEDKMFLVGADANPYKWMKMADLYVQPSRFEGHSVTMMEAKALEKMIIASDIPDFKEQLKGGKGLIASNINDFYEQINNLLYYPQKVEKYKNELKKEKSDLKELKKLIQLIDKV